MNTSFGGHGELGFLHNLQIQPPQHDIFKINILAPPYVVSQGPAHVFFSFAHAARGWGSGWGSYFTPFYWKDLVKDIFLVLFGLETRAPSRAFAKKHCSPYAVEHCSVPQAVEHHGTMVTYGWFQKWWYPQIINFNRVFHYKPAILGAQPYFWVDTHMVTHILGYVTCPFAIDAIRWKRLSRIEVASTDIPKCTCVQKLGGCLVLLLMLWLVNQPPPNVPPPPEIRPKGLFNHWFPLIRPY